MLHLCAVRMLFACVVKLVVEENEKSVCVCVCASLERAGCEVT